MARSSDRAPSSDFPLEAHPLLLQRLDEVAWRKVEIEEHGGAFLLGTTIQVPALEV